MFNLSNLIRIRFGPLLLFFFFFFTILYMRTLHSDNSAKNKGPTNHHRHTQKKNLFIWFYLQFTNMYCSVCWVIFRWWLLFMCVCIFLNHLDCLSVFFFALRTYRLCENYIYSESFWRPAQIQIKLIANCWHFFIVHFSLYIFLDCLTQRVVTVWRWKWCI